MAALSPEMINEINKLQTLDDCQKAWKLIKARFRAIEDEYSEVALPKFKVGQVVEFKGRRNRMIQGKIIKKNIKTAKVDCDIDGIWNASYTMLRIVE